MLQKLRQDSHLSRQHLAEQLGLSPGYILKAEQCVFPSPPAPLIEYWHQRANIDRDILKASYYAQQRAHRRDWLNSWVPDNDNLRLTPGDRLSGFCSLWANRFTPSYHPTQYAVSSGLCVPASAVYWAERNPSKPLASSIITAVDDLCDYATSGEFAAMDYMDVDTQDIIEGLLTIKEVITRDHRHSSSRVSA